MIEPRSGRVLKPKKFGDTSTATLGSPKPDPATPTDGDQPPAKKQARSSLRGGGKKEEEAVKEEEVKPEQPAEPRKMWVKVTAIKENC